MFSKWFLLHMNIDDNYNKANYNYNDNNIVYNIPKHEKCIDGSYGKPYDNHHFMDMFFYNFNDLRVNSSKNKNGKELLCLIFDTMLSLLNNKMTINDTMLLLTFEICKIIDFNNNNSNNKQSSLMNTYHYCS